MNTTKLDEQFGDILIPRDRAASQIIDHLEGGKSLPLISVHGPSGVGKSDLAGPILLQRLRKISGKSTPKLLRIQISKDDSAIDVALKITDLILDHHGEFRSRKSAKVFREKILRSVRRSPSEAAERLRTMMRSSESAKFDLRKIQLVICLDGVDKLFENRARCGADLSKSAICGDVNDPVGFLNKLVGMKTILFTMAFRSWIARDVRTILERGSIDRTRRIDQLLSYPDAEEVEEIVKKVLEPIKKENKNQSEIEEYGDLLADTLRKNPALIGVLPTVVEKMFRDMNGGYTRGEGCVDRHLANNGLLGDLTGKADEIYLQQNANNKLALEEVFSNLIKGEGRLLIKDAVMSDELWAIALNFVGNRILAIDGRSYRDARFIVTHKGLLTNWTRTENWTGARKSVGITQLRSLDDRALSWQLADKNKALLISSEPIKEDAELILKDSELSSQLSPLTREFLTKSLKPKRELKKILVSRKLWIPIGSLFALFFLFCVVVVVMPDPGAPQATVEPAPPTPEKQEAAPQPEPEKETAAPEMIAGPVPAPKSFIEEAKVAPLTDELLATAEQLSATSELITEEVILLPEETLLAKPLPVPTEVEVITAVDQITSKAGSEESAIPMALPSAQAHFEKSLVELKQGQNGKKQATETPKKKAEKPARKTAAETKVKKADTTVGKAVPQEGLESAGGHIEKVVLKQPKDDSHRLYEGLTNRRLEVGGAETRIVNITQNSSWREILNSMGSAIAEDDLDVVLDSLKSFHDKTIQFPDEIENIQVSEFKDLTSHLGKVALIQQDRIAMQGAWKLELVSQNVVELNTHLRMLMARLALNAGRNEEAVAYLAQTKIEGEINQASIDFVKAAIGWHFDEGGKAAESFRKVLPPQARVD